MEGKELIKHINSIRIQLEMFSRLADIAKA